MFRRLHEKNGVTFHMNAHVSSFRGGNTVREVMLDSGERLAADMVIARTGVESATAFMTGVALDEDGGIAVDDKMRAASGLFAAGDIAGFTLPGSNKTLRIERTYTGVPYFWTFH